MRHRLKKVSITVSIFIVLTLIFINSSWYKSNFPECTYTEEILEISPELKNIQLYLEKDAILVKGIYPPFKDVKCMSNLGPLDNELWGEPHQMIYGRSGEVFHKGEYLTIEKIIAAWKHGLEAIEGHGPTFYLVLRDKEGILYRLAFADLMPEESYKIKVVLSYYNGQNKYLTSMYFRNYYSCNYYNKDSDGNFDRDLIGNLIVNPRCSIIPQSN